MIDLIIPTIPGREESLERCLNSFEAMSGDVRPIVMRNSPTCGQGWLDGLETASDADYVALIADDLECASESWAEICIQTVDEGLLPCPRVWQPTGGIESQGGDMNALGHIIPRHQKDRTPVDFTTVPFMSREQVEDIWMIPTQYCCDVWVSYRGRQLGYETVLRHGFDLIHHQEQAGRGAGMGQNERDLLDLETMLDELNYGSHVPHLRAILDEVRPKRVLEIGSGRYSTREFLRDADLERLDSVEDDPEWRERVLGIFPDERLWMLTELPDRLDYDLVFVDGPEDQEKREAMIRAVLSRPHPITLVHDAEQARYRKAIEDNTNGDVSYLKAWVPRFLIGDVSHTPVDQKDTAVCR